MNTRASVLVFAVVGAVGGCRETPPPPPPERITNVPALDELPKPSEPPPPAIDLALADGLEMRRPIKDGRLTIIPIIATRPGIGTGNPPPYVTLHSGMARGDVRVTELGPWDVDTVRITNTSENPIAILGGEVILDGKQDRVLQHAVVIPRNSTKLVAARCVERHREHGGDRFSSGNAIAELSLRKVIATGNQDAIWARVNVINRREGLSPGTQTYRHAARKLASNERVAAIMKQLAGREERKQIVGLAVAIDDKVVAIDRFATPELYRALEPQLIAGYLPETDGDEIAEKTISPDAVRALARFRRAHVTDASSMTLRN
ncbi:MAG TPA: DUF6569 family protein [Kofleriaceae bacterium]